MARLRHLAPIETVEVPDLSRRRGLKGAVLLAAEGAELARVIGRESRKVVLDERGRQFSSPEFARWFAAEQLHGTREDCVCHWRTGRCCPRAFGTGAPPAVLGQDDLAARDGPSAAGGTDLSRIEHIAEHSVS